MPDQCTIRVIKKADDPLGVVRVSLGSGRDPDGKPFLYIVYRGTKEEARDCARGALVALDAMIQTLGELEPEVAPDDGKRYA